MSVNGEIRQREGELRSFLKSKEVGPNLYDMNATDIAEARDRNNELVKLNSNLDFIKMGDLAARQLAERRREEKIALPTFDNRPLSRRVAESNEYWERSIHGCFDLEMDCIDFKSLLSISNGTYLPSNPRTDIVNVFPQRRPVIADAIPQDPTRLQIVKYMRGTAINSTAASTSEGGAKSEVGFTFEEESSPAIKITAWLPVTEEQIDDVYGLKNLIDNQLLLQLGLNEETKILGGPGGGDMTGFYNTVGVQTQSLGSNTLVDAIYLAMSKVIDTGFATPSAVMIESSDFDAMRLAKNLVNDYIWGPPSLPGPDTIWGKPAIVSPAVTAGSPLVGDFVQHSHISRRMDGRVRVTDSHLDYFANNILAIVGEERISLEIYRPSAFCFVN